MFTIDANAKITVYPAGGVADATDSGTYVHTETELAALIQAKPGSWAVQLWNDLPGVTPIQTPKFRNRETAVERIWAKLAELYPDAILESDMPKAKVRHANAAKGSKPGRSAKHPARTGRNPANSTSHARSVAANGTRKSAWAEELTQELRKRYKTGEDFELADVYKLIPQFQRRHKENHHIAARLRTTLAQDLRGHGIVKALKKGKYRMLAA